MRRVRGKKVGVRVYLSKDLKRRLERAAAQETEFYHLSMWRRSVSELAAHLLEWALAYYEDHPGDEQGILAPVNATSELMLREAGLLVFDGKRWRRGKFVPAGVSLESRGWPARRFPARPPATRLDRGTPDVQ